MPRLHTVIPSAVYLLICHVRDVPTQHVIQEDAQAPHCDPLCCVSPGPHPLWWCILPRTIVLIIPTTHPGTPRTKVNQLHCPCLLLYQDILILDITVENPSLLAHHDSLHHLPEDGPGCVL